MDDAAYLLLIERYVAGECTPAERDRVERWLAEDPGRHAILDDMRRIWTQGRDSAAPFESAPAWKAVSARLRLPEESSARGAPASHVDRPLRVRRGPPRSAWRRAVLFGSGVLAAATVLWLVATVHGPSAQRVYATTVGQRETVTLADGTQITLAPASRLEVDPDYGGVARQVTLVDGEAYFAVVHDARRPFAVHARNALVTDVGTRFTVRAYPEEPAVRVVVADGAVALGGDRVQRAAMLRRGMLGAVDSVGGTMVVSGVDVDAYTAWTRGTLAFHATPLAEVVRDLSRWYGMDIRVSGPVADARVSATYTTEAPDEVLSLIAVATGTRYERHGRTIVLVRP